MLSSEEATLPSFHDKIRIAKVREYDYASVNRQIENLACLCDESTDMQVVKMMKEMVPEFLSKNSVYESLD